MGGALRGSGLVSEHDLECLGMSEQCTFVFQSQNCAILMLKITFPSPSAGRGMPAVTAVSSVTCLCRILAVADSDKGCQNSSRS